MLKTAPRENEHCNKGWKLKHNFQKNTLQKLSKY